MVDELMIDESQLSSAPLSDYPILDIFKEMVALLTQIRDILNTTKPLGVTLGGSNARELSGSIGQDVSKGVLDNVRLPGQSVEVRKVEPTSL
jgi:hypothetical protein